MIATGKLWSAVFSSKALAALLVAVGLCRQLDVEGVRGGFSGWQPCRKAVGCMFSTRDVAQYLHLSRTGYRLGSKNCAFYPLWPGAIHLATLMRGRRPVLAAMLLTNALSLLGFWLLYRLVERHCGPETARDSLIVTLAFPGALFFSFPYSESIFLVLVLLFFWGLELQRWSWAAAAGFLLPMTRATGVFVLAPLAWWLWEEQKVGRGKQKLDDNNSEFANAGAEERHGPWRAGQLALRTLWRAAGRRRLAPWLLLLCPLLGYAAYFGLMHLWTGNALEGFAAQKFYPNSPSIANMFDISGFGNALLNVRTLDGMTDSALDRIFFLLFLALLWPIYRLNKVWFWYVLPAGLVPALSSWFMSYRRYIMVLFPMFVVLAVALRRTKSRWLFWYYVVLLAAIQAWAVKQFVSFKWAG